MSVTVRYIVIVLMNEIGVYNLFTLFESIADNFEKHLETVFSIFLRTIQDPESDVVRVTTLQALGKVSEFIDPEDKDAVNHFRAVLPNMLAVLRSSISKGEEEASRKGFEVFDNILLLETPILTNPHLQELVQFLTSVAAEKSLDESIRIMAISSLIWCVIYKKGKLQKLKLVEPILRAVLPVGAEEEPEDADENHPAKNTFQLINAVALNLSPQLVFPILAQHIVEYIRSPDAGFRKAAMLCITVMIDGCADYMRSRVAEMIPILVAGLQDPDAIVRRAACMALAAVAEELDSEVAEAHATLLPLIFNIVNDNNPLVQKYSVHALDVILEGLGSDIQPYLNTLMEKLIHIIDFGASEVKATAVGAIGSAAHAAQNNFLPYFQATMFKLQQRMTNGTTDEEVLLRGLATDTMSAVAEAVGKEAFSPYMQSIMEVTIQGLNMQNSRLKECSYCFFGVMGRVFEQDFAPYLPAVMPHILSSCTQEEKPFEQEEAEEEEIDISSEGDNEERSFSVNSAIAEEKETAADALGELFSSIKAPFLPYVQESVNALLELLEHYNERVRKSALSSLYQFVHGFYDMSTPQKWIPGLPVQVPFHDNVANIVQLAMEKSLVMIEEEDDKITTISAFQELTELIKHLGPGLLKDYHAKVLELTHSVFLKRHLCQQELEDEEAEEDEDLAEYDALLIGAAADTVAAISLAMGPAFSETFKTFFPLISKYTKANRSTAERSSSIGAIAEAIVGLKEGSASFTSALLEMFLNGLRDPEEEVKSNSAYGFGILCAHSPVDLTSHYMTVLQLLHPLFSVNAQGNLVDNCCGCLSRMIMRAPTIIPLDHVLPILLQSLPLKKDYEENVPILSCLMFLLRENNAVIMQHLGSLMSIFESVLSPPDIQLDDEIRGELVQLLKNFRNMNASGFDELTTGKMAIRNAIGL
jgi:HEAT repeat protein